MIGILSWVASYQKEKKKVCIHQMLDKWQQWWLQVSFPNVPCVPHDARIRSLNLKISKKRQTFSHCQVRILKFKEVTWELVRTQARVQTDCIPLHTIQTCINSGKHDHRIAFDNGKNIIFHNFAPSNSDYKSTSLSQIQNTQVSLSYDGIKIGVWKCPILTAIWLMTKAK